MAAPSRITPSTALSAALTPRTSTVEKALWLRPPQAKLPVLTLFMAEHFDFSKYTYLLRIEVDAVSHIK